MYWPNITHLNDDATISQLYRYCAYDIGRLVVAVAISAGGGSICSLVARGRDDSPTYCLVGRNLSASLRDLCDNFSQRTRLAIRYSGDEVDVTVPDAVHLSFYRCLQEALTNVVKHAQATEVRVALKHKGSEIRLSIWDNGIGFDPAQPLSQGLGLLGMKERFERLGGSLTIISQVNQGTMLTVYVTI